MSHLARALVLAVALALVSAAPAHAGTIVFDFEDGLQGWELFGPVQRVQTQLLGGGWAIFGDGLLFEPLVPGPPFIIGSDTFLIFGDWADLPIPESLGLVTFDVVVVEAGGLAEPSSTLVAVATSPTGIVPTVAIEWSIVGVRRVGPDGTILPVPPPVGVVAFIDNITFHTIPEPSVLGLLALAAPLLGASGWLMRRRLGERG